MRLLLIEDDVALGEGIHRALGREGYTVDWLKDGSSALHALLSETFDVAVLDLGLPRMDGFQVLKALRGMDVQIPILMVTARTGVEDTVQGLESGANDYIAKPFRFEELLARVKLRAREATAGAVSADVLTLGDLSLDLRSRIAECTVDGAPREVELSSREFTMARVFLENAGQVLTRDLLLSKVWGYDYDGASNVVDVYVGYLRGKLGAPRLVTVRGAGYKMVDPTA